MSLARPILRRRRRTIDDSLQLIQSVQRQTIATLCARIDQVQAQADRQDTAETEVESRLADMEPKVSELLRLAGALTSHQLMVQTEHEARIADLEGLISDLVWLVGQVAARGRPVLCLKCRTAYATTGLRWTGRNLVLVCPVCGPMTWKRP